MSLRLRNYPSKSKDMKEILLNYIMLISQSNMLEWAKGVFKIIYSVAWGRVFGDEAPTW
jgi:hypothetical protein